MESMFSKVWKRLHVKKSPISIMIIGLDDSGKTSILSRLASIDNDKHYNSAKPSNTSHSGSEAQPLCSTRIRADEEVNVNKGRVMPTVGYNFERIQYRDTTINVLDFSGHTRYRNLWQEFYDSVDGIVYVIDSSDIIRLVVVRDEIETMLSHPYFASLADQTTTHLSSDFSPAASPIIVQKKFTIKQGKLVQSPLDAGWETSILNLNDNQHNIKSRRRTRIPILFLANKVDLGNAYDADTIIKALSLNQLPLNRHPWMIQATSAKLNSGISSGFDWLTKQVSLDR